MCEHLWTTSRQKRNHFRGLRRLLWRAVNRAAAETVSADAADGFYELLHAKLARLALAQGAALPAADPSQRGDGAQPRPKDDDP
jgi:hypothetical protein